MKFASLGSGSEGNALLAASAETVVMLDCGFNVRETERRLARLALTPAQISGIVVTHEHSDHVGGVFKFARRHAVPVWLSWGTFQAARQDSRGVDVRFCCDGSSFIIDALEFTPYTVPHDAREPLQYVASDATSRLGVLTDAGHVTPHLVEALGGCDALMLECNHDREMLRNSVYPPSLKQRIGGAYGHLANEASSEILATMDRSRLKTVVGAHLSKQNNTPTLARNAIMAGLNGQEVAVMIACQEEGFGWIAV